MNRVFFRNLLLILTVSILACADPNYKKNKEGEDTDESGTETETSGTDAVTPSGESFRTDCGVVVAGALQNPVYSSQGERVRVTQIVDPTFVIVRRQAGDQLVQLQGIRSLAPHEGTAVGFLQALSQEDAYLFEPGTACFSETASGGRGIVGHLLSASGESYAEKLLSEGVVDSVALPSCSSDLVSACYAALQSEPPPTSAGEVTDFLWKPQADSQFNPGKLVIHASPCNLQVIVNGESLPDYGSGNGRCITARSQKTGCAYGNNVRVQLIDISSGLPYTHNGQPYVIVPSGCQRFEFKK